MEGKMPNAGNKLVIEMAPWTNGDAIRDMTDEELANEFAKIEGDPYNGATIGFWLDWLREEVTDG